MKFIAFYLNPLFEREKIVVITFWRICSLKTKYLLFNSFFQHRQFFSLQLLREAVHKHVTPDPQKYGLDSMTLAFSEHKLHVCPGHTQTWQANKEITEVSV